MKRALVFIVAYKAESTILSVLQRIPQDIPNVSFEVLIIDDASDDATYELGKEAARGQKLPFPITVLKNPENQQYGGNQKIGFLYAIEKGFDIVVLLHGDGQYAPEAIPELIQPLIAGEADAVFGSRMISRWGALRGGMPLYKYIANKILTAFENAMLRTHFSEFHSGYRLYTIEALKRIPFELNTNAFHFDTEIIIQLVFAGLRIQEIPIPTYYGSEICRVNGIKYGLDVIRATTAARLQKYQLLYRRNFDVEWAAEAEPNVHYASKLNYPSSHLLALNAVPEKTRVMDIGCGPGAFQEALRKKGCRVVGVDQYPAPESSLFEKMIVTDLDQNPIPESLEKIDVVLMLDVIEHLKSPETFFRKLHEAAQSNLSVKLVLTTGNVAFILIRLMLLLGQFNYGKRGILDLTHTRLFTFGSLRRLLQQYGFEIVQERGIPVPYPEALGEGSFSRLLLLLNQWGIRLSKGLFSYQIYVEFRANANLEALLEKTLQANVGPWRN
ncbi:MAG: bifunctional glycosyltransferase/class I SAM-dependent methyltransferase [Verrucomicrobiota bacterium]